MSKLKGPDGRIPDRLPDGRPAVAWERRWTEGTLPLWLVATAGGIAVIFVLGIFVYGSTKVSELEANIFLNLEL